VNEKRKKNEGDETNKDTGSKKFKQTHILIYCWEGLLIGLRKEFKFYGTLYTPGRI